MDGTHATSSNPSGGGLVREVLIFGMVEKSPIYTSKESGSRLSEYVVRR